MDSYVLLFTYPSVLNPSEQQEAAYIRPVVKLEMGVGSDPYPIGIHTVTSYAALVFPSVFQEPNGEVVALEAERTFWEKATLLHAEFHRSPEKATPHRLSRHFSDLARLAKNPMAANALSDVALRKRVVEHKSFFFRSSSAHYETAVPGSFHLLPVEARKDDLQRDYQSMREMFLEEPPSWESILQVIGELESAINNLPK
ncbi:MAG: hypothetical protein JWQ02_2226 [Capsulimonas sp.]|nr:hypothetical protein [Capsulimonas sp.]